MRLNLTMPQFPALSEKDASKSACCTRLFGLSEFMASEPREECRAHSKGETVGIA